VQLWTNILSRRRQFRRIPECRLSLKDYHDDDKKAVDKTYGRMAAVIDGFNFDWSARRIPRLTYLATDIVHWLALETALQAITDAGFTMENFPGRRTGVIVGNSLTGEQSRSYNLRIRWPYVRKAFLGSAHRCQMAAQEIQALEKALEASYKSAFPAVNEDTLAGGLSNTIAGRICNFLNLDGGGYTVDGACSSSLLAIATAASGLAAGDLDMALAGGVDNSLDPFEMVGFSKTGALTAGEMTVYDRRASGFIPGEGCGFVVLKRHTDALRDGNEIYAVLQGWGISSDGGNAAITAPSVSGQFLALKRAYKNANYGIGKLNFIEGHGTGTAVGDRVELEAIGSLINQGFQQDKDTGRFCGITSLKSIVGHTKAASGIGGFIKAVIAVNRRIYPPTAGCRYPNEVFNESARSVFPIRTGRCMPPNDTMRAGVSAMGFGGINSHVTVASAGVPSSKFEPELEEQILMASAQDNEIFILSAENISNLTAKCLALANKIEGISYAEMTDLAAGLGQEADAGHNLRAAFIAEHPDEAAEKLHKLKSVVATNALNPGQVYRDATKRIWLGNPAGSPRVGFLFPGQGSQKLNMAGILVERFQWARELVQLADLLSEEFGVRSLSHVMYPPIDQARDAEQIDAWFRELSLTANAQPAICLASILWFRFLGELGITPVTVGGHSLGEATAFYAAGAFDETALLRFAYRRGQAMSQCQAKDGAMLSLRCSRRQIESLLEKISDGFVALANINAPNQMVASGELHSIEQLSRLAKAEGIAVSRLPVSHAFHCSLTLPAAEKLAEKAILPDRMIEPAIRLFSGMDGREISAGQALQRHFVRQVTAQVNFMALVESLAGCADVLIEVGPGRVLSGLVDAIVPNGGPLCMPTESSPFQTGDLNGMLAELFVNGLSINWPALYANRLVYPFIPPAERSFLTNPCENPLDMEVVDMSSYQAAAQKPLLPDLPDLPRETLRIYLEKRGAFLSDVIKADLKHASAAGKPENIESSQPDAGDGTIINPESSLISGSDQVSRVDRSAVEILYELVADITGFPKETLTLDSRLLDDLNLDSIKSGDLIARYAEHFGLAGELDPAEWTNASLGEIVDLIADRSSDDAIHLHQDSILNESDVLQVLVEQTSRILGIPTAGIPVDDPIGPGLSIGADQLHLLLKATSEALKFDLSLDLQPLLSRSPAQIAEIFTRLANAAKKTDPYSVFNLPYTWVRELRIDVVERERPELPSWYGKRTEDQWSNAQVLILSDDSLDAICQAIERRLVRLGAEVLLSTFERVQSGAFKDSVDGFSHFIAVLPRTFGQSDISDDHLRHIIRRLSFAAVPPPASHGPRRRNCLVFVQFGGGFFGTRSDEAFLDQCCATALAKSVYLEREDLKTRVIDFDPRIEVDLVAEKTILELQGPQNFVEVGYDQHLIRRTTVANPIDPAQYDEDPIPWSNNDVILVTGGAKGITAECALDLARTVGAKMALIGRTPLHKLEAAVQDETTIPGILQRYEKKGLQAQYYSCDICDRESVAQTVGQIQKDLGNITGIIHGAGQNTPRRFYQASVEDALTEVAPKVIGALNLLSELGETPLKLIVGLTSIIGITGMQGNGWYAFSNEALDLILRRHASNHPSTRTLSVAYSIWRDEGMGARMGSVKALKIKGIDAIPTDEGVRRFVRLFLHNPGTHQVLVTARMTQLDTLGTPTAPAINRARFLEKRIHFTPGIESAFLAHLSLDEDLYLQDHCYNDSYLFPTVFGLEAMAQAVAHVTGVTGFRGVRVEDLVLRRPIVVDPEKGADIIIWAQTRERATAEDKLAVRAGIFKLGADPNSDFFGATFVMGSIDAATQQPLDFPQEALDMHPSTDLYRQTLLFQGPRFQRIDQVHVLERQTDESGMVVVSTPPPDPDCTRLAFAGAQHQHFILGDPFQRDNLLQSAALLIPQDTSLPMSIRRWDIYPQSELSSEHRRVFIQTRLQSHQDQEVLTAVDSLDQSGVLTERLSGYRLKILKHHEDYPTVADLLRPDERDTRQLQNRLAELAAKLRLKIPDICVSYIPGLHDLPRDQRRARELPLLDQTLQGWAERNDADTSRLKIQWQPSGKPEVWESDPPAGISLAHDNRYCLVAAASRPLGCDLAPVTHRTPQQWEGLLGPFGRDLIDGQPAGDELNRRGSALWAAREVLQKLNVNKPLSIEFEIPADDSILFACTTNQGLIKILTLRTVLTRGRERVLAMSVADSPAALTADEAPAVDYPGYGALFNRQHYKIIEGGPQGQGIFVYRFPVTFMPAGQLSRHVYYSHYLFWAGEAREASAWPVLKKIADQFATGQWGGVTNFADLKILGEATTHDLIEVWLWASSNGGPQNSVLDLTFDFRKVLPTGGYERLAWLDQQTTWVRLLDHGVARVEPYPDYYGTFLNDMLPKYEAPNTPEPLLEPLKALFEHEDERYQYRAPAGPIVEPALLSQQMETSLEDANIVGNIYFANYYAWQGRVRDRYFYELIPEYFQGTGDKGELICLNCRVDHLREAMPFDRIEVRMALKALKECHATLYFEYFKSHPDGRPLKLATGKQEVVWVRRDAHKNPVPHPFPSAVQGALQKAIVDQYPN
jgi:acyl transferase domain-containing protein/NAD(P)-dependent dehydrogenase (short-subunit alcohol dehydrogenase family)/acyl-CoA thioesterase FadM/acyl carrier protein